MMQDQQIIHLRIEGMMCQRNCGTNRSAFARVFAHDGESVQRLKSYSNTKILFVWNLTGTTVQNALRTLPGVESVEVSFAHKYASMTVSNSTIDFESLQEMAVECIDAVGFDAFPIRDVGSIQHKVHLRVEGMMCQKNCGSTVEGALKGLLGVVSAEASFSKSYATVTATLEHYGSGSLLARIQNLQDDAVEAVECVGFDALLLSEEVVMEFLETQQYGDSATCSLSSEDDEFALDKCSLDGNVASLSVKGMSCAVCVGRVVSMLKNVDGVRDASVALTTHRAQIQIDSGDIRAIAEACADAVTKGGYKCSVLHAGAGGRGISLVENASQLEESRRHELQTWRSLLITSTFLSVPLVILHHREFLCLHKLGVPFCQETIQLVLATLVQCIVGKRYYIAAWNGWANGRFLGMDFLVVLGTSAAYLFSVVTYIKHLVEHTDTGMKEAAFETGGMLFTFVTLGKFLEAYAKGKTASALQMLMELQPSTDRKSTRLNSSHVD